MKTVHKSVLIWYTPQEMYVLVTDVNRYAEFLPWCDHARVVEEHEDGMTAEMGIAFGGVQQNFTTRNVHTPGSRVDMQLQMVLFPSWMDIGFFLPWGMDHNVPARLS